MRKMIFNLVMIVALTLVIGTKGIFYNTWQYWACLGLALGLELNNMFD